TRSAKLASGTGAKLRSTAARVSDLLQPSPNSVEKTKTINSPDQPMSHAETCPKEHPYLWVSEAPGRAQGGYSLRRCVALAGIRQACEAIVTRPSIARPLTSQTESL